ncbi:hypothetical protein HJC23_003307 [Cyclotella cryptica]|uniref:Hexose transporter 1 n=1 Tax=Cyclotella cryptica TaxID=29204 RepID=A0ABD3QYI3_9STRA|eukprot:CCRYP_000862-RC/>CCRYP_000862-RC protein AED:0.05 eAED:0.05 QI:255/0.83/0.85/1/0.5/0.28/7/1480/688
MANRYGDTTKLGGDEEGRRLLDGNTSGYGASLTQPATNVYSMQHQSQPFGMSNMAVGTESITKSYSVHGDGSLSYLTPLQLGRHELYEMIPFTAVFGMQKKEKNISKAFASYAADLQAFEDDQKLFAQTNQHLSAAELNSRKSHTSLLLLDELDMDSVLITTPLIIAVLVSGMSQFLVGFNTGVMNSSSSVVFVGHSTFAWSVAVAAFCLGGPFGAIIAGSIVDKRGRRGALAINAYTFLIGGLIQTFAVNMVCITLGRLVIGFASGFSTVLVPIYLGELAPPTLRGTLGTLTQFCLVVGILVSDLLAFPFADEQRWRILFAVTPAASIVQILCFPFLIESPRWLLARDQKSLLARHFIKQLRGLRHDHEVETEVSHFISASNVQCCDKADKVLVNMMKDKNLRRLLLCALYLQMAQQLSGINAVFYYSSMFFEGLIDNPLVGTSIVGAVNCLATYVALLLMEKSNRRTLILWSAGGMLVSSVALVLCLLGYFNKMLSLCFVIGYVSFFEIGLGPIPWLIVAEMFEAKVSTNTPLSLIVSASCQLNWACNFIVGLCFPYLQEKLGAYSFVPFAAVLLITMVFVIVWLPETKGTTPEELRVEIVRSLSSMFALSDDSTNDDYASSGGNLDVEWRRAMNDLRRQEEEDMMRGTFNYGFQPIEQKEADEQHSVITPDVSDWKNRITGGLGI